MPETIRLRTQVGVDREINVQLDQDFEQLEILSLKVRSEDVYTRMCAEYGVIVGRVIVNGGYGVPNVKVSVFVPLTDADAENDIIRTLYPYTSITDVNEDGYRYNLLPYEPQYTGHVPTGTFPSRNDALTNPAVIEVYDKYYKFTVKTNGSGDYMIMGVPVGNHTLVMDCDLSDIGPFSQSPQDLIRMGRATADQLDGVNFKSSPNLAVLPQIVNINKGVNVNPFWGQPEICQINIARSDFDLQSAGVNIQPTSIFMGSLVTGIDDESVEKNCKPPRDMGNLCNLSVGPGEIISVRQTIYQDAFGRPILEQGTLPQGGKLIDNDGVWVVDVPMNLDYVTTNEFGEQILSQDPSVGIPTKGKYRFKIKYAQPTNFSTEEVRRGYFLVPNIKEYGWTNSENDPAYIKDTNDTNYKQFLASYYFGVDWNGYANQSDAIACKDTFYEMEYNKVYTVSQHYDEYKKGTNRSKYIGIKEINDNSCASENNKFPATDAVQNFDFLNFLVNLIIPINYYSILAILPVIHILALIWPFLQLIITLIVEVVLVLVYGICVFLTKLPKWLGGFDGPCKEPPKFSDLYKSLQNPFKNIKLPIISYPECQFCDCKPTNVNGDTGAVKDAQKQTAQATVSQGSNFFTFTNYTGGQFGPDSILQKTLAAPGISPESLKLPIYQPQSSGISFVNNLPIWETVNKFNLKGKYFDSDVYGGSNRIKVSVEPTLNPGTSHYDNVMIYLTDPGIQVAPGQLLTFQQNALSKDPNPTVVTTGNTTGITGTTLQGKTITMTYADPTSQTQQSVNYVLNGSTKIENENYKFASDLEYFQVIKSITYSDFVTQNSNSFTTSFLRQIDEQIKFFNNQGNDGVTTYYDYYENWVGGNIGILIMVRGVDPYSGKKKIKYDLSRIFGYNTWGNVEVDGDFYLNIPVQPGLKNVRHNEFNTNLENHNGYLYYNSFTYTAGTNFTPYTTDLQSYYSSLDQTQINVYKPNSSNPNSLLISSMINVGSQGELLGKQTTPSGVGYNGNEYIEGGSYVWYGSYATVKIVDGDNNNNMIPQYYYSPRYSNKNMTIYGTKLVMRSDRLPTGSQVEISGNNNFAWQASNTMAYSVIPITGNAILSSTVAGAGGINPTGNPDSTNSSFNRLADSFTCSGMVDLNCYTNGPNGEFIVLPPTNSCNKDSGGSEIVSSGCYNFVSTPVVTLLDDYTSLAQWLQRFKLNFAICRGVMSRTFVNSWLNGTLFAFPFASTVFFDSKNKPYNRFVNILGNVSYTYCADLLVYEPSSNNFYYRSSPYNGTDFIGMKKNYLLSQPVNGKDLLFPTTILDLGPKYIWQFEVNKTPNYYGYQMDRFKPTSWNDDSTLVELFIVSRILNKNFLSSLADSIFGNTVSQMFNRDEDRVSGDFAQMLQINSQYGVKPFTSENYSDDPTKGSESPVYVGFDNKNNPVFGVFLSGSTQQRDLISPRRLNRTLTGTTLVADYLGTKSQAVPYFKWINTTWQDGEYKSIFGNQYNTWHTYGLDPTIENGKYQEFDRRVKPFFIGNELIQNSYGYVYNRLSNGLYDNNPYDIKTTNAKTLTSAPWYFYFGLKKGKTAIDKFVQQYLGT